MIPFPFNIPLTHQPSHLMATENLNPEEILESRRKAIAESITVISVEDLKKLGETLFPYFDHPWRTAFFNFIGENANATFHHAKTGERIEFIYCNAGNNGMWFIPGSGMGPLQEKGLKVFKQIVEGKR